MTDNSEKRPTSGAMRAPVVDDVVRSQAMDLATKFSVAAVATGAAVSTTNVVNTAEAFRKFLAGEQ